jgi:RNA polymerase sigma-70 factor (ECF subfamily)
VSDARRLFKENLLAGIPALCALANCLVGDAARADDLVEETLIKVWKNPASSPQTPSQVWLFAALHNIFYAQHLERRHAVEAADAPLPGGPLRMRDRGDALRPEGFRLALQELPPEHREALILVSASGLTHQQAAMVCDCAADTIASRIHRARFWLAELLGLDAAEAMESDTHWREPSDSGHSQLSRLE